MTSILVAAVFAILVVKAGGISTHLSFIRVTTVELGLFFYVWSFMILSAVSKAVNLTDGLDGLASGSSALVLAAYVFMAFWQDRHSCFLPPMGSPACYPIGGRTALDIAIVAAGAPRGLARFLLW